MRPESERICDDPLAKDFLGTMFGIMVKSRLLRKVGLWVAERQPPGAPSALAAHTNYIDECLKERIDDGIEQLVNLGAGHDSRAYRFDGLKGKVKVFEVDLPATLRVKMEKVKKVFGSLPDNVVYVPINFEKENLDERLFASGYNRNGKTFFIWEAVTFHLTVEAVDETSAFVANNSGKGSSIIFDYLFPLVLDGTSRVKGVKKWQKDYKGGDGGLSFRIEAESLEEFLSPRGFGQVKNVTGGFLKRAYFKGPNEGRKVFALWGIVDAIVRSHEST